MNTMDKSMFFKYTLSWLIKLCSIIFHFCSTSCKLQLKSVEAVSQHTAVKTLVSCGTLKDKTNHGRQEKSYQENVKEREEYQEIEIFKALEVKVVLWNKEISDGHE